MPSAFFLAQAPGIQHSKGVGRIRRVYHVCKDYVIQNKTRLQFFSSQKTETKCTWKVVRTEKDSNTASSAELLPTCQQTHLPGHRIRPITALGDVPDMTKGKHDDHSGVDFAALHVDFTVVMNNVAGVMFLGTKTEFVPY